MSGSCAHAYGYWGSLLGPVFHRYRDAHRFAKLACDLVEKHGFVACRAKVQYTMGKVAFWTQPIATAIDHMRQTSRVVIETGDVTLACYGTIQSVTGLLLRNDPLDAVWRESEMALDFARQARYGDGADMIGCQRRFIATMQGRTATVSTLGDAELDEATFEAQLTTDRMPFVVGWYWILELKARFLSGDYAEALVAADKATPLLSAAPGQIHLLDYYYYAALTLAALFEQGSADEQTVWRDLLTAHREQLREWADVYLPTFGDKHALVSAELARLEGRELDAMRLYERAIALAREHGFVQNEGLAHEVAARFYAARGFDSFAHAYRRRARDCYRRWGAEGKVRQLEQLHPELREEPTPAPVAAMFDAAVAQLDVGAVVKASHAISGEIVLDRLIETLMTIALEDAGAERGLLLLLQGDAPQIEAEAITRHGRVEVTVRQAPVTSAALPQSALQYVLRTRERVVLDDASARSVYAEDAYVRQTRPRSVLCLPVIKQATLVGALYLENNLTPRAFTAERVAVLELLASQAAISLENARLYADLLAENRDRQRAEDELRRSEASLAEAQEISHTGSWRWKVDTDELSWSAEVRRIHAFGPVAPLPPAATFMAMVHADDRPAFQDVIGRALRERSRFQYEYRMVLLDGSVKRLYIVGRPDIARSGALEYVGVVMDVTERRRAEEAVREAQAELARVARLTTMGELAASIAHEINQPLAAIVSNGGAGLRWLNREPPDLAEAQGAFARIVSDGKRAGDVIRGLRGLAKKSGPLLTTLDINDVIHEVLALTHSELQRHGVALHTDLAASDRPVVGDRVQLQQVLLNLILNGIDAMKAVTDAKELTVSSALTEPGSVLVAVEDRGPGLDPAIAHRIFEPFFTTKSDGLGMGLSICRSIIDAHGGRLWVASCEPHGTVFRFTVPIGVVT
jgi:signal transduction histidine kinase/GAF domain-containing protein